MIPTLKLPFSFDPRPLRDESLSFSQEEWTPHFNKGYYEGDWSGIALRAPANVHPLLALYPNPTAKVYEDTPALAECPSVARVLDRFECPTESVRFLRLSAGSSIREHQDYDLGIEDGVARIHIPIQTSSEVEFYLDGNRVIMNEGEAWYLNFNLPHRVENRSTMDRIHLVIDCVANDWLLSFFD